MQILGQNTSLQTDGFNIWPALNKLNSTERDMMVLNLDMDDQSANFQFAVRQDNWKIIWGHPKLFGVHKKPKIDRVQLYDLDSDPTEQTDLSASEPEKVSELQSLILSLVAELKPAFSPNRLSLAFPRYNSGLLRPGWCEAGWEEILWRHENHWDTVLASLQSGGEDEEEEEYEYY